MCWKNIFLDSEKLFFRKARFQSTKGLLTQRNAIKTIFGNLKKCFCDRAGSFGHWFSGDRQKVCKFCPRFHGVKARKHILSNLIFARGKMHSPQQGTAAAAAAAIAAAAAASAAGEAGEARCSTRSSQHTVCIRWLGCGMLFTTMTWGRGSSRRRSSNSRGWSNHGILRLRWATSTELCHFLLHSFVGLPKMNKPTKCYS